MAKQLADAANAKRGEATPMDPTIRKAQGRLQRAEEKIEELLAFEEGIIKLQQELEKMQGSIQDQVREADDATALAETKRRQGC